MDINNKEVVEANEQNKEEHEMHRALRASDMATKELLGFAGNRLNMFCDYKLYKPTQSASQPRR